MIIKREKEEEEEEEGGGGGGGGGKNWLDFTLIVQLRPRLPQIGKKHGAPQRKLPGDGNGHETASVKVTRSYRVFLPSFFFTYGLVSSTNVILIHFFKTRLEKTNLT